MEWFKNDWFKSKKRKELEKELQDLKQENEQLTTKANAVVQKYTEDRLYKNIFFSNGIVTLVMNQGTVLTKTGADASFVDRIKNAKSEDEIFNMFFVAPVVEIKIDTIEERNLVTNNLNILRNHKDFKIIDNKVYFKDVSLELPSIITSGFIEILEKGLKVSSVQEAVELSDQYEALRMFWLKLALNGIEQSRLDLLNFCKNNSVRITKNGNLVLYRRIVTTGTKDKSLVAFISQKYYDVKKWKKSPKNYWVITDDNGNLTLLKYQPRNNGLGNLSDLYKNLPNMKSNSYTSSHNKGKLTIKIGDIYRIDDSEINLDNGLCAAGGLHAAAVNYNYSGFGDTPVVVLVNPSKAITVPKNETGKLRTTEMFIACINDKPHGTHFDEEALTSFDEEYNNKTIEELEEAIKNKSFSPASVEDKVSPITFVDLQNIKDMLNKRKVNI